MLKTILYLFEKLEEMLNKYQEEQSELIENTEEELRKQKKNLMIAEKLSKKLEL